MSAHLHTDTQTTSQPGVQTSISSRIVEIQREVLEQIATGQPLNAILGRLCSLIEAARNDGMCSILLLDKTSQALEPGVGPSLNPKALEALRGLPAADCSGSCGTAAYTGKLVIVDNTATDIRWSSGPLQDFANSFDVKACWSNPFFSAHETVLGTFAISLKQTGEPSPQDLELLRAAAHLAGIAVERDKTERALHHAHAHVQTLLDERTTDLKQARSQLVELGRKAGKAEIAASVLHNVGNVLNSVNVSTQTLQEHVHGANLDNLQRLSTMFTDNAHRLGDFLAEEDKGPHVAQYLADLANHLTQTHSSLGEELTRLQSNVAHIKSIVARQQTYATPASTATKCWPKELMRDALSLSSLVNNPPGIQIEEIYSDDLPTIWNERDKILQILVNLIVNALQAIASTESKEGYIHLTVTLTEDEQVMFAVKDNGVGISDQHKPLIFTHGFSTRPDGHGYGLHNAHLAAQSMDGVLVFESQGIAQGATFKLIIPQGKHNATDERSNAQ